MGLSLKRYLSSAIRWLSVFAVLELVICLLHLAEVEATAIVFPSIVGFICLLPPGAYYLTMFFVFKKKCENVAPAEGVITNWEAGFYRYTGSVIIKDGGKEYATSAYFSQKEAKELVGKTVSYAIIGDTLFIYEIKELA